MANGPRYSANNPPSRASPSVETERVPVIVTCRPMRDPLSHVSSNVIYRTRPGDDPIGPAVLR
ncbi:hypothetical protein GCM10010428_71020 [Actinosynnema pretiosum subsp. pretiosum]